jgi:hypothetical protein
LASDRRIGSRAPIAVAAALALWPSFASAQPDDATQKDSARQLGREGVRRYEAGDWEGARQLFRQAYRLVPAPTLALREARALVKLNRLVDAAEAYARASNTPMGATPPDAFRQAVAAARVELDNLRPRIPRLLITVQGADPKKHDVVVRLDGVDVPPAFLGVERTVDPGMHHVQAVARGARPASETVTLQESDVRTVVLQVEPSTDPVPVAKQPEPDKVENHGPGAKRTLGWVGLGLGATGVAVGVATGLMALDKKSSLDDACSGTRCPPSASDDLDAFRTLRTVSTVGYISGGVLSAIGVTLLLTSGDDEPRPQTGSARTQATRVQPWVGAGSAGVRGNF